MAFPIAIPLAISAIKALLNIRGQFDVILSLKEAAADLPFKLHPLLKLEHTLDGIESPRIAQPEIDEGAIYLATTAAIFYVWVFELKSQVGLPDA